jgi:hypothetical protein
VLAYVFWHWKKPAVPSAEYEARLERFQSALAYQPPVGFARAYCCALAGAPWLNSGGSGYEDWYLVDGSAALDPLNDAAISASRLAPHDEAASAAAGGTAGLYRLRLGASPSVPRFAYWFAKPDGMPYRDLYDTLESMIAKEQAALWGRQMTLGPAMEFCLHAPRGVTIPATLSALALDLRPVWPRAS